MLRVKILLGAVTALLCFVSRPASAMDDWLPVTQEELKMTSQDAPGSHAVILYHEELSDDNKNTSIKYTRIKILTEKGKQYADIELRYWGGDFHIIDIKARTIAPDGTITPFTGKAFDKTIVKGRGVRYLAKTFTLPNVQVGSIIEWRYHEYWGDNQLFAPHWTVQQDLPEKRAKFSFSPYRGSGVISDQHGVKDRVYYTLMGLPKDTAIKLLPDGKFILEVKDIPAYQEEVFSPPEDAMKMRVNFYYGNENMTKPAEFWKEEGKYWNKDVEKFIGHSSAVAAALSQVTAPSDLPEQQARKIYAFVHKMRNQTYEQDQSALEELAQDLRKDKPKVTVEEVLNKKSGFRDELTRLYVAMLRAENIPAYVMRVAARDETFFDPNLPNWRQLTAEIAVVHLGSRDFFVDPGTPYCPFELMEWTRTSVQGVRQNATGGTELAQTPAVDYRQAVTKRVAQLTIADDGSVKGPVTLSWDGQEALAHRLSAFRTDEAGRKKELEDELRSLLPHGSNVKLESATGWDNPDVPLKATFSVEVPGFASATGKRLLLPSMLFDVNSKVRFTEAERKNPVYFPYPFATVDVMQITLPSNIQVENLPQTPPVKSDFAVYMMDRSAKGNVLTFKRDFVIAGFAFPAKYYQDLKSFYTGVSHGDEEHAVLTVAAKP